jgi:hypothetical protein
LSPKKDRRKIAQDSPCIKSREHYFFRHFQQKSFSCRGSGSATECKFSVRELAPDACDAQRMQRKSLPWLGKAEISAADAAVEYFVNR